MLLLTGGRTSNSTGVSFNFEKKISTASSNPTVTFGRKNDAFDSDFDDDDDTNFSGSYRGSIGQERNSQFVEIREGSQSVI